MLARVLRHVLFCSAAAVRRQSSGGCWQAAEGPGLQIVAATARDLAFAGSTGVVAMVSTCMNGGQMTGVAVLCCGVCAV